MVSADDQPLAAGGRPRQVKFGLAADIKIRSPKSRMSDQLRQRLFAELDSIRLIDPHSHIEPKSAASKTLADILGYHYYTELIHSTGMPRAEIEEPDLAPRKKSADWSSGLSRSATRSNTVGSWNWPERSLTYRRTRI